MENKKKNSLSSKDIFIKGSIIAIIVTLPSLASFGLVWYISGELIHAAIIGAVVHFLALGFSFKISKKLLVSKSDNTPEHN